MPGVCRKDDVCSGHGCYPSRANTAWSPDTFVNGRNVHRQGDSWASHCWGTPCHGGTLASGSSTHFTNGKQTGRCGDPISCGSSVSTCSDDTIVGG